MNTDEAQQSTRRASVVIYYVSLSLLLFGSGSMPTLSEIDGKKMAGAANKAVHIRQSTSAAVASADGARSLVVSVVVCVPILLPVGLSSQAE